MPVEFLIFGLTLAGVAIFHRQALPIAACGLATIIAFEWTFTQFPAGPGAAGLAGHFAHEWVTLVNLLFLLVGFAMVAGFPSTAAGRSGWPSGAGRSCGRCE